MTQPLRRIVPAQPQDPPEPREDCAACRAKDMTIEALQARIEALTVAVPRIPPHRQESHPERVVIREGEKMNRKDLRLAVADDLLTGAGLDLSIIQYEGLIKAEQSRPTPDHDRLESLYATRASLRRLKERSS